MKRFKLFTILLVLALIIQVFVPLVQVVYAENTDTKEQQIHYLPILRENDTVEQNVRLKSSSRDQYVGRYDFMGEKVSVYIDPEVYYPAYGRVPVIIELYTESGDANSLYDAEYTFTLKNAFEELIPEEIIVNNNYSYQGSVYLLALFPNYITPGDYEIKLEVESISGLNSLYTTDDITILEETNEDKEIIVDEEVIEEEIIEEEVIQEVIIEEENEENMIPSPPVDASDSEIVLESLSTTDEVSTEDNESNEVLDTIEEDSNEQIELINDDEIVVEENDIQDKNIEEPTDELENVIQFYQENSDSYFSTDYVSLKLSYEEIIDENVMVLEEHNPSFYVRNLGIYGDIEANIEDENGNVVYTSNQRASYDYELYERDYQLKYPFYTIDNYYVYSGNVDLFKVQDTSAGYHTLNVLIDGEEIYSKEIEIMPRSSIVNSVRVDKYLLAGDREFKIEVNGMYLTNKDLLELEIVDSNDEIVALTVNSQYSNVSNDASYTEILYTMEVVEGKEIEDYVNYNIKLIYSGQDELIVRTTYTSISTTTRPKIVDVDTSLLDQGKIMLEGINLSEDNDYMAEVYYNGDLLGNYHLTYINSRTLSLYLDKSLSNGYYDIDVYELQNFGEYSYRNHIGYVYFYYYDDVVEQTGGIELSYISPYMITPNELSFIGEAYITNFKVTNIDDVEINLVDKYDNVVCEATILDTYYESNWNESITTFEMNFSTHLENNEVYQYVYNYKGEEIKNYREERHTLYVTDEPYISGLEVINSNYDKLIGINDDVKFRIIDARNIEDINNLNVYIEDNNGNKIAILIEDTIKLDEEYGSNNYIGSMRYITDNLDDDIYRVMVSYNDEDIFERKIEIITKPYVEYFGLNRTISKGSKTYTITLEDTLNIIGNDLVVKIKDMLGKEVATEIIDVREWAYDNYYNSVNYEIVVQFGEPLQDAYYEVEIYYDGIELLDEYTDYYEKSFYSTGKIMLTGHSYSKRYEDQDVKMSLTYFTQVTNIQPNEKYLGYFYLTGNNYHDLEYFGKVELTSGVNYENTGIFIPSEEFTDYPEGRYDLFITKLDGELLGRSYFRIRDKIYKTDNPGDPVDRHPSYTINNGAVYTNSKDVTLKISSDGYTLMKIANSEEGLLNAETIAVQSSIDWTLLEGDGEKTIYIEFLDDNSTSSKIIFKGVTLDTIAPTINEVTISNNGELYTGSWFDLNVLANEKGKGYATFYLDNVEKNKIPLEYRGKVDNLFKYSFDDQLKEEIDKITIQIEDLAGNVSAVKEIEVTVVNLQSNWLWLKVIDENEMPQSNVYISIYNYQKGIYEWGYTGEDGVVEFYLPSNYQYEGYVYSDGYWDFFDFNLTEDIDKVITIPARRLINGQATINVSGVNEPVVGASIIFTGNGEQFYTTTDSLGYYSVYVIGNGDFEVTATHPLYTSVATTISSTDATHDIEFYNKVKVYGTVKDNSGNPIKNLRIYANGYNDWKETLTNAEGEYELRLQSGEYTISHSWVPNHISQYDNITIGNNELEKGYIQNNFILEAINYYNSFNGEGNNIKSDVSTTQRGKTFNIIANYKNNGTLKATGKVIVDLPNGVELVAGKKEISFTDLGPNESGKVLLTVKVTDDYKGNKVVIPAKLNINSEDYSVGFVEVDLIDVTITAPKIVGDGNFKVYGEATEGSTVSIIDKNTNTLLAVGKVIGKWYTANIADLPDGDYKLFAKAEKVGNIANSTTIDVTVDSINGINVKDIKVVTSGGNEIGMNHEIGVPAFSAWVDLDLRGNDIEIDVKLSKDIEGMDVEFLFADKIYSASNTNGRWKATLRDWSGSGTKQIMIKIIINGFEYEFVVGEVIILIDPSGYVYDINTGERIVGATATVEKWNADKNNWEKWNAELYGQINPQLTDEEGKYGWMVEDGTYRVIVEKEGYEKAIAGDDKSIIIPPPREDVFIGLKSKVESYEMMNLDKAKSDDYSWTIEFSEEVDADSVNKDNVYIMDGYGNKLNFIEPVVEGYKIKLDNKGLFKAGNDYTIVIKKTVRSASGNSLKQSINANFSY